MDWDIHERYKSTLLLAGLLFLSASLLAFHKNTTVHYFQVFLVRFALPPQRYLTQVSMPASASPGLLPPAQGDAIEAMPAVTDLSASAELLRKVRVLEDENTKLRGVLSLKSERWPRSVAAHVVGRDPQRWFQDIVLDKGSNDGLSVDDPVLALSDGREALIGRITEVSPRVAKVMLVQDPLSAVAAEVAGLSGDDGVVEGTNSHELLLKYLDRSSQVKIGDLVSASGLGKIFPAGVPLGWVQSIDPDPSKLFLQARLRPAAKSNALRTVLVITTGRNQE